MSTVIVGAILLVAVYMAVRTIYKDKKAGKSCHCGGSCSHCNGSCHEDLKQYLQELRKSN